MSRTHGALTPPTTGARFYGPRDARRGHKQYMKRHHRHTNLLYVYKTNAFNTHRNPITLGTTKSGQQQPPYAERAGWKPRRHRDAKRSARSPGRVG